MTGPDSGRIFPVQPKIHIGPGDVDQPRRVEWGHMSQVRGRVADDRVRVERQSRKHSFRRGMSDSGPSIPLFSGSLTDAVNVYVALDALFDGGEYESAEEATPDVDPPTMDHVGTIYREHDGEVGPQETRMRRATMDAVRGLEFEGAPADVAVAELREVADRVDELGYDVLGSEFDAR